MKWALARAWRSGKLGAEQDINARWLACVPPRSRVAACWQPRKCAGCRVCAWFALEDDPLFNAGTGSVLNRAGEAEMDASVMTGHDLGFGGVAALSRVRNPILVARAVMEHSGHALLAGEGALRFAREQGFDDYDPITPQALQEYRRSYRAVASRYSGGSGVGCSGPVVLPLRRPAACC